MIGRIITQRQNSIEPITKTPQKIIFERSYTYKQNKGITMFANNLLKYLWSCFCSLSNCNCYIEKPVDKSKLSGETHK